MSSGSLALRRINFLCMGIRLACRVSDMLTSLRADCDTGASEVLCQATASNGDILQSP
jgi:hypothetical protein